MASIHLLTLPTTSHFSTQHSFFLTPFKTQLTKPISLSPCFPSLSISKTPNPNPNPNRSFLLFASVSGATETKAVVEEEEREEEEEEGCRTRIIAQNVPWLATVDDLRPLFEKFGTVVNIEMSMYNKTRNRGLAFITMGSNEEALAALSNLESFEFEGRSLNLAWAKPRKKKLPVSTPPKPAPIHNLFVANLPFNARAKDLKEFFNSENGNVVSAEIIFNENPRRSAGYGFVSFYTKEEAEAALVAFQEKEFMGRGIRVARSKRFLRQGTKESIQAESESTELSSNPEQSKAAN